MKIHASKILTSIILGGLLLSCGQDGKGGGKGPSGGAQAEESEEDSSGGTATDGSNITGYYLATFSTLNSQVNGTIPGSATLYRKEERLFAYLRLFAGQPSAWHPQKIYTGRCPVQSDDANNDGYVDIVEAEAVLGKILIPLDADLSTQNSGRNFYPVGDLSGSYHYERVVNFKRFFDDLKDEDRHPEDNVVKLGPDEGLVIEGRPVLVQGVAESVEFPETVAAGTTKHRPFQTFPIACGVFKKADFTPGRSDDGTIPGPIADVEEGQDHPAPDDGPTGSGTTGGTVSTGTNENEDGETETRDEDGNRHGGGTTSGGTASGGTTSGGTTSGGTTSGTGTSGETEGSTTSGNT